jgi:hypothetical protein
MVLFEGENVEPDEAKNVAIAGLRRGFSTKYGPKFALQKVLINDDRALKAAAAAKAPSIPALIQN